MRLPGGRGTCKFLGAWRPIDSTTSPNALRSAESRVRRSRWSPCVVDRWRVRAYNARMAAPAQRKYSVEVELPTEAYRHHPWDPEQLSQELRVLWLVEQVRERRLGYGKAAELAGMNKLDFVALLGRHKVSVFDYDPEERAAELQAGREIGSKK